MPDTCRGCGATPAPSARWCGHCGARLTTPVRRTAQQERSATRDRALIGAGSTALLVDERSEPQEATPTAPAWSPRARLAAAGGVLLVLVGVLVLRPEPEVVYDDRGFTARGDAARSGVVSLAPLETPVRVAWSADVGSARTISRVRAAGDAVLEQTSGGALALRDASTADVRWLRRDLPGAGWAVRVGDVVVVPTEAGPLRGFDVADGTERWRLDDVGRSFLHPMGDAVAVRTPGRLRAVVAATGEVRWDLDDARDLEGSIQEVVPGGAGIGLWVTSPPGLPPDSPRVTHRIMLLDPTTGLARFSRTLAFPYRSAPVAVGSRHVAWDDRGRVVVATPEGRVVHRIDDLGGGILAASGELLALTPWDGGVIGIDLRTGTQRWSRPDVTTDRLTAADGLVLAGDGTLIDALTGRTLSNQRRLELDAVAGETTLLALPAVAGTDLEIRDRAGATVTTVPLLPDPAEAPAVGAGRVFVPTREGVAAYRVADGGHEWAFGQLPTPAGIGGTQATARTPVVADTTVLVGPGPGWGAGPGLVALELSGGVRAWDREGDAPTVAGPLTLADDVAFVPVGGEIHAYDTRTGRRAFAAIAGTKRGPIVVGPNRVIAGPALPVGAEAGTEAVAILRRDRSENWRAPLAPCSGPVLAGEHVAWGTAGGVTALVERTGAPAWSVATRRPVCLDPVTARGLLVTVEDPGTLFAVSVTDGARRWSRDLSSPAVASPVAAGEHLLVPLLDGTLAAYLLADGSPAWTFDLGGVADASPAVLDGRILVHLRDGRLIALAS